MLPEAITIPAATAATLRFDGPVTATDQAAIIIVSWLAANRADGERTVDVREKGLREALMGPRRQPDNRRDDERMDRLAQTIVRTDERLPDLESGAAAPLIEVGMRRTLLAGCQRWTIDPAITDAFKLLGSDEPVSIPVELLRRARCRYSTLLYMRLAAYVAGELDRKWIRKATEDKLLLRVPIADFRDELGYTDKAADLGRYVLEPACREISTLTDLHVDAVLVRAPSRTGSGRVMAIDILISHPALEQPRKRVRRPKAEEPLPSNVYRLRRPLRTTLAEFPKSDEPVEF